MFQEENTYALNKGLDKLEQSILFLFIYFFLGKTSHEIGSGDFSSYENISILDISTPKNLFWFFSFLYFCIKVKVTKKIWKAANTSRL